VNAREAADALGLPTADEAGVVAAAGRLADRGATVALVTRGTAGAILRDDHGRVWRIGPPPELGPYSVGSGDALLAGFAAALARGATLAEAARHGCAAACANAIRPGQGELDPADAERVLPGISLEELATS
jgi:fructose-1-phosphate kinase PfkB-like protein